MKLDVNYIDVELFNAVKGAFDSGERSFDFEIDSMGGELFYALQTYDLLRSDPSVKVSAHVAGACMSAATVILCTAPLDARSSTSNSVFMIHSPSTVVFDQINKRDVERLAADINLMNSQIENIYAERTSIPNDIMKQWMDQEKTFNAQDALQNGFIGKIDVMYNFVNKNIKNKNTMIKNIKNFVISLVTQLKNEAFKTADGIEFETLSLEVGSPVENLEDGVYTLEDGRTITVEKGIITDVIEVTNEGDGDSDTTPGEGDGEGSGDGDGDGEGSGEGDGEGEGDGDGEGDDSVAEEKIKKIVEETVAAMKNSIIAQYKPIMDLVHECGGVERLQALKNANPAPKKFESNKGNKKLSSLEELMNRCTK